MINAAPFFNDAVSNTIVQVKSSRGDLYGLKLVNTTAATAYLQIFGELAANVVLGTTAPVMTIRLAANESIFCSTPVPVSVGPNGISVAGTTTPTGSTGAAISVGALVG